MKPRRFLAALTILDEGQPSAARRIQSRDAVRRINSMNPAMIRLASLLVRAAFAFAALFVPFGLWAQSRTVTYIFPQSFNVSLGTGYSWGITSLHPDPSITGQTTVANISVSGSASVTGAPTGGFDWIVLVGSAPFGFPTSGQVFVNSTNNPFSLSPTAPVEFHFAEQPGGSTVINGSFDFPTNAFSTPCCGVNRYVSATASPMNLTNGLYVQMLLYTGDPTTNMTVSNLQVTLQLTSCDLGLPDSVIHSPSGPASDDGHPTSMVASFEPPTIDATSLNALSAAAKACGYTGFNWQQLMEHFPYDCLVNSSSGIVQAPPALYDPPPGYSAPGLSTSDSYPFFYSATDIATGLACEGTDCPTAASSLGSLQGFPITSVDGNTLNFFDAPYCPLLAPRDYMSFETQLVGLTPSNAFGDVLHKWTWESTYNNATGGVAQTASRLPVIGGTGGITLTSIDGAPIATFSAFSSKLEVSTTSTTTSFQLVSNFTLGSTSDGINPLTEATVLSVGSYSVIIPARSFHQNGKGYYAYQGTIKGESLQLQIVPGTTSNTYTLKAEGSGATPVILGNPAWVALRIGNDMGAGATTLSN